MRSTIVYNIRVTKSTVAIAVLGILACCATTRAQDQGTLRKIEIVGYQRLNPDQIVQMTGLLLGDKVDVRAFDVAEDKLVRSGLFRRVSYRVHREDNDVTVTFDVEEKPTAGLATTSDVLGSVVWRGNRALTNQELAGAFALQSGGAATRDKIDQALEAVRKAYGRRGYINAQIAQTSTSDANHRVNFEFVIREGQQFHMGILSVTGLTAADAQRLKSKWTLTTGSIFDDSYLEQFRSTVLRPFVAELGQRSRQRMRFDVATRPDSQKQTVDVIITFR